MINMKTKLITFSIKSSKEVLNEFATTLAQAREGKQRKPHHEISFESIEALRNVLTKKRLEILSIVKHQQPKSVYELSKKLSRDLKSVNIDLSILEKNDFIELQKIDIGRQRIVPKVNFDNIKIIMNV